MTKHSSNSRSRKGFSLVELTMVLIVLGIVAAIGFPRWAAAQSRYQLNHAESRLQSDMLLVQAEARSAGAERTVRFNIPGNSYELVGVDGSLTDGAAVVYLSEEPFGAKLVSVTGLTDGVWTFDGHGGFTGGSITVEVAGTQRTFVVSYTSGAPVLVLTKNGSSTVEELVAQPAPVAP